MVLRRKQCNGENWINYITGLFWFCLALVLLFLLLVFYVVVAVVWQNLPTLWQNKSLITKTQSSSPRFWQQITHCSVLFCAPNESQTESKTSCNYDSLTFRSPIENGTSSSGNPQTRTKCLEPNVLAPHSSLLSRRLNPETGSSRLSALLTLISEFLGNGGTLQKSHMCPSPKIVILIIIIKIPRGLLSCKLTN